MCLLLLPAKALPLSGDWWCELDKECLPCALSSVSAFIVFSFFMIAIPVLATPPSHNPVLSVILRSFVFIFLSTWVFFKLKASMKLLVVWSAVFSSRPPSCALHVTRLQKDPLSLCIFVFSGRGCIPGLCRIRLRALQCKPHSASPQLLLRPLSTLWKFLHCFLSSASLCPFVPMS